MFLSRPQHTTLHTLLRVSQLPKRSFIPSGVFRGLHTKEEESARLWLADFTASQIPRTHFAISYSRSSGPGGQKVNKTSSKATVALEAYQWRNPAFCSWIPAPVLSQLAENPIRYQTKTGGVVVQSDSSRSREANCDECFRKLLEAIKEKVHFEAEASEEDKKKWERVAERGRERRLEGKKRQAEKKKARSKQFDI